jgi:TolC family type I secretion outer membrane protein
MSLPELRRVLTGRSVLATLLAAATLVAAATDGRAETLEEAMAKAIKSNPRLKAEAARQRSTEADLKGAKASFLPSVSSTNNWTLRGDTTYFPRMRNKPPDNPYSYGVTINQPVFDGFRRYNDVKRASASVEAGSSLVTDAEQSVLLDAAAAYLSIVRDAEIVRLREEQVRITADIAQSVKIRFDGGETTKTDMAQAQARLQLARADLERARGELAASRTDFEKIVGVKPTGKLVRPPIPLNLLPTSAEDAVIAAGASNPKLIAANLTAVAADYSAKMVKSELAPQVNLEVSRLNEYNYSYSVNRRSEFAVRLGVVVPLVQPTLYPRIEQARETAIQKRYEAQDAKQGVTAAAEAAFERHQAALRRAGAIDKQVVAADAAVVGVRKEFDAGARAVIDVLDAEQEAVQAKIGRVLTRYDNDYTAYVLLATVGRLTAGMLGLR